MSDILIICSPGGHLSEALDLFFDLPYKKKYIISDKNKFNSSDNYIGIINSERDLKIIIQFFYAIYFFYKEKPKIIISTGAGVCVPFFILSKIFNIPSIYIESPTRITTPSMSAKIIQYLATKLYVRSPLLLKKLKNSIYVN
jgi:beta-1,4-N-acetylglucosaminyltransferase